MKSPSRHIHALCAASVLFCTLPLLAAEGTPAPSATPTTTGTLQSNTQYFPVPQQDRPSTLPLTSNVADESSKTVGKVTVAPEQETSGVVGTESSGTLEIVFEPTEPSTNLPVKVDNSSTAAQVQQLLKFEKRNRMAEAFLLACELVRQNPDAEVAYDAAIRTSLVLGHEQDVDSFYRLAIKHARLPGKYHVQLAHFYDRTGKAELLKKLLAEYEKNNVRDPDYAITLVRLYVITNDLPRARTLLEKGLQQKTVLFPILVLTTRLYRGLDMPDRARETLVGAADQDLSPWQKREMLLEYLKLPGLKPEEIGRMVDAALSNEQEYSLAKGIADVIIDRTIEQRQFHPMKQWLLGRIKSGETRDIELWLLAYMLRAEGDEEQALRVLTSEQAKDTPVISYERAMALARANRFNEAIPILNVQLAEQPEVAVRLALGEQYLAAGKARNALQVMSLVPLHRLTADQRRKTCELRINAAVAVADPDRIVQEWIELSQIATFSDLQAMGDVVLKALSDQKLRDKVAVLLDRRTSDAQGWPLLLLRARICSLEGDHTSELQHYSEYLEYDRGNVQMLRFAAELAAQYASMPIALGAQSSKDPKKQITIRATDMSGTELAIQLYRRLIELQPMVPDNYSALMRIYQTRGEVETAKKVAIEVAERNGRSAEMLAMAASALDENGFPVEALEFYRESLNLVPDDFAVRLKYANALRQTKDYEGAKKIYRDMLERGLHGTAYNQPQLFAALLKLANDTKELPELSTYLDGLRQKEIPGKAEFYLSASKLLMQIGSDDKAEVFLREFEKKFAEHKLLPDSYLLLGQLYYNRHKPEQAIEQFRRVQEMFQNNPASITAGYNIGEVHRQVGAYKDALDTWLNLARANPADDKALSGIYQAAVLANSDMKDAGLAKQLFQQFVDSNSQNFKLVRTARANLKRLAESNGPVELEKI